MNTRSALIQTLGIPMHAVSGAVHKVMHLHIPFIAKRVHRNHVEMSVGAVVMSVGVVIAKAAPHGAVLHIAFDVIGYSIHGIGLIPFAKIAERYFKGGEE